MRTTWTLLALLTALISSGAHAQEPAAGRFSRCAFNVNQQGTQLFVDGALFGTRVSPFELDRARVMMLQADLLTSGNCSRFGWLNLKPRSPSGFVCSAQHTGSTVRLFLDDFVFSEALDTNTPDLVLAAVRAADQRAGGACMRNGWVDRKTP